MQTREEKIASVSKKIADLESALDVNYNKELKAYHSFCRAHAGQPDINASYDKQPETFAFALEKHKLNLQKSIFETEIIVHQAILILSPLIANSEPSTLSDIFSTVATLQKGGESAAKKIIDSVTDLKDSLQDEVKNADVSESSQSDELREIAQNITERENKFESFFSVAKAVSADKKVKEEYLQALYVVLLMKIKLNALKMESYINNNTSCALADLTIHDQVLLLSRVMSFLDDSRVLIDDFIACAKQMDLFVDVFAPQETHVADIQSQLKEALHESKNHLSKEIVKITHIPPEKFKLLAKLKYIVNPIYDIELSASDKFYAIKITNADWNFYDRKMGEKLCISFDLFLKQLNINKFPQRRMGFFCDGNKLNEIKMHPDLSVCWEYNFYHEGYNPTLLHQLVLAFLSNQRIEHCRQLVQSGELSRQWRLSKPCSDLHTMRASMFFAQASRQVVDIRESKHATAKSRGYDVTEDVRLFLHAQFSKHWDQIVSDMQHKKESWSKEWVAQLAARMAEISSEYVIPFHHVQTEFQQFLNKYTARPLALCAPDEHAVVESENGLSHDVHVQMALGYGELTQSLRDEMQRFAGSGFKPHSRL